MITEFKIINASSADAVSQNAALAIKEGWQPFGSVSSCSHNSRVHWSQGFVKYASKSGNSGATIELVGDKESIGEASIHLKS